MLPGRCCCRRTPGNAGPTLKAGGRVGLGGRDSGSRLSTFVTFDLQAVQQYLGCWFQHRTLQTDQRGNVLILTPVFLMSAGCPHCKCEPPSTLWWWPCQTHPRSTGSCVSHSTYTALTQQGCDLQLHQERSQNWRWRQSSHETHGASCLCGGCPARPLATPTCAAKRESSHAQPQNNKMESSLAQPQNNKIESSLAEPQNNKDRVQSCSTTKNKAKNNNNKNTICSILIKYIVSSSGPG